MNDEKSGVTPPGGPQKMHTYLDDMNEAKQASGDSAQVNIPLEQILKGLKMAKSVPPTPPSVPIASRPTITPHPIPAQPIPVNPFTQGQFVRAPKSPSTLSTIHTYNSDVGESVVENKTSLSQITLAETERRNTEALSEDLDATDKSNTFRNIILIALSMILLGGGAGLAYYYGYYKNHHEVVIIKQDEEKRFIATEAIRDIVMDMQNRDTALASLLNEAQSTKVDFLGIEQLRVFNDQSQTILTTSQDFFNTIAKNAPESLSRVLDSKFFYGVYNSGQISPILIFNSRDYETSYAGMIAWEKNMVRDIQGIFLKNEDRVVGTSLVTRTGVRYAFQDALIQNKDARVIRNSVGQTILLYSIVDSSTIVITTSETTLKEVVARLVKNRIVR